MYLFTHKIFFIIVSRAKKLHLAWLGGEGRMRRREEFVHSIKIWPDLEKKVRVHFEHYRVMKSWEC